ncbi:hypothetical protein ACFL1H_08330 [Nanoarchaeota archaeon]
MPSISTLIGKRFEDILQEKYPELKYIGDDKNLVPDFEHELFYAEAKVAFDKHDYAAHLKQYQIDAFKPYEKIKPVIYIIGFHNFERSMTELSGLTTRQVKNRLRKNMNINKFYLVNKKTIENIWNKRNYVCEKGHIQDCTLRYGMLDQIILNKEIFPNGKSYTAREYYQIPTKNYSFSLPQDSPIKLGYILPNKLEDIIDYFN